MNADLKESVHCFHALSENFPGNKSIKEEYHRTYGVNIGLNEANLINDVHLITSLCDVWNNQK